MVNYYWILVWLLALSYVESHVRCYRREMVPGISVEVKRLVPWMAFFVMLPVIWWAGERPVGYADTAAYHDMYRTYPTTWDGFLNYIPKIAKDPGFYGVSAFIRLMNVDVRNYFRLLALFQGVCMLKLFRKYSADYSLSVALFVLSTDALGWMFNGIRQYTAVCITLLAFPYILEKKYLRAVAIVLVASLFHQSALLMLPLIFVVQGKAWNWKTLSILAGLMMAVFLVGQFTTWLDDALQGTQYQNVVSDYTGGGDDGTHPLRVLVYSVPAILGFFGRKKITEESGRLINICTNLSIVSAGIYLVSMVTSGIYIGRLPIYCSLYGYILLPWEIEQLFEGKNRRTVYMLTIGFYLAFYLYSVR